MPSHKRTSSDFESDFESGCERERAVRSSAGGKRKKRVNLACTNCRARKIRCDGNEICSNCRTSGVTCEHSKVTPEENRLARLRKASARAFRHARETGEAPQLPDNYEELQELGHAAAIAKSLAPPIAFDEVLAVNRRPVRARKVRTGSFSAPSSAAASPMAPSSPFHLPAHAPVMLTAPPAFPLASPIVLPPEPESRRSSVDRPVDSSSGALERAMRRYEGGVTAREFGRKRQVSGADIPAPLVLDRSAHAFGAPWSDVPRPATLQVPGTATPMQYGWSDGSMVSTSAADFTFSPHMQYAGQTPDIGSGYSSVTAHSSPASSVSGFSPIVQPAKLFDWRTQAPVDELDGLEPLGLASSVVPPPPFAWHDHSRSASVAHAEASYGWSRADAMPRSEFPAYSAVPYSSFGGFDFLVAPDTIALADIHPLA